MALIRSLLLSQAAGLVEITCVPHVVQIPYATARHMLEGALATPRRRGWCRLRK